MRRARVWLWMILVVGCGGRVEIGRDLPDGRTPGSGGASGRGGNWGQAGVPGTGGSTAGGVGGASAGGAGGIGGEGGSGGTTGVGGKAGVGGSGGASGTSGTGGTGATDGGGSSGASGAATGGSSGSAGSAGSGPKDGGRLPGWPAPTMCPPYVPSPLTGQWVGHIDSYHFPSGSDLVHIFIEGADATSLCGSITFGVGPLPPPATDPDVGYPPGASLDRNSIAWYAPYEGFNYRLADATVIGNDMRFTIRGYEVWKSWCVLQTSYPSEGDAAYRCRQQGTPASSTESGADGGTECFIVDTFGQSHMIDCDKMNLCGGVGGSDSVCDCNATGCNAHASRRLHDLNVQFDGNQMKGYVHFAGPGAGHVAYAVELVRN
jgi:hypothetical protein